MPSAYVDSKHHEACALESQEIDISTSALCYCGNATATFFREDASLI
jgi:hypothetical protein